MDWRSYLWRYLTHLPTDFNAFDRRFVGRGIYLDEIAGESVRVLVAVDTSGSIDHADTDFVIQDPAIHGIAGLVNLFGIESPGLTSSMALAEEVAARLGRA